MIFQEEDTPVIKANVFDVFNTSKYVYYLMDEKKQVLYVGSTKNLLSRMRNHTSEGKIPYKKFSYTECTSKEALKIEKEMIIKYFPPYNKKVKWNEIIQKMTFNDKEAQKISEFLELSRNAFPDAIKELIGIKLKLDKFIENSFNSAVTVEELRGDGEKTA